VGVLAIQYDSFMVAPYPARRSRRARVDDGMRRRRILAVVLALVTAFVAPVFAEEPPPLTQGAYRTGYVPMADGTQLRYTVFLPPGPGPFPTLMQYDVYAAGTNPEENGQAVLGERMRAKGYAILGVSIRGSGCSSGTFDVFSPQSALDGYAAVEWAAQQPWSNGDVGMFGVSFPAIMSLYVAALRPPHLRAVAPGAALSDLYRDVAYPGGLLNTTFVSAWTALQKTTGYQDTALVVANDRDPACLGYTAGHQQPDKVVAAQAVQAPYADDAFWSRSLGDRIADIDVPVLAETAWQDEQVGSRVASAYRALDIAKSWQVVTNGGHGVSVTAPAFTDLEESFFDRFVGGVANGFDTTTPHIQVWHELQSASYEPRWVTSYPSWPAVTATTYDLTSGGALSTSGAGPAGSVSYGYPGLGTSAASAGDDTPVEAAPYVLPSTGASFTTDAFATDVELFGTASADLWLSSTARDTDVQVTLSEVRPDGQETFVQRGWLRASHRALDASRSTALLPYHPHTRASLAPLTPGVATPLRVEIWPSDHVFRAGSRLRLTVEPPVGATGMRSLLIDPVPALNTVWTGGLTPSRLVVGTVPATGVVAAYPDCGSLVNQPCRPAS
jgi:putative CocE/NonD family hydrolase